MVYCDRSLLKPLQYLVIGLHSLARGDLRSHSDASGLGKLTRSLESLNSYLLVGSVREQIQVDHRVIVDIRR